MSKGGNKRRSKSSLRYLDFQRSLGKLKVLKPSNRVLIAMVLAVAIFILGGGIYDLIYKPIAVLPVRGRWIFYYPYSINEQILNESIMVMLLYTLGLAGLIFTYQSTKYTYKPRRAIATLILGIALLIIAFAYTEHLLNLKGF